MQFKKSGITNREIVIRILEHNPEMIVNHIERHLATADRSPDEGHDDVMDIIEKKLITGTGRDLFKGSKGVGAQFFVITNPVGFLQPFRFDEYFLEALELCIVHDKDHVGLVDDG